MKRCARRVVIEAGNAVRDPGGAVTARGLTYHRIGPEARDDSWVTEASFREQVRFLATQCEVRPPETLSTDCAGGGKPRVCITIDDGHVSALAVAAPVLHDAGLPAVFFVSTDAIGMRNQLTRSQIRELAEAGFAIGSHSCSHRSMPSLPPIERHREARESKCILEEITGRQVMSFAYPYGTKSDFDAATERALASAGYARAFTAQHGPICASTPAFRMPRVKVDAGDSLATFAKIVSGAADLWRWVDEHFAWLQRGPHRRPVWIERV